MQFMRICVGIERKQNLNYFLSIFTQMNGKEIEFMFQKLEDVEKRYEELTEKISGNCSNFFMAKINERTC